MVVDAVDIYSTLSINLRFSIFYRFRTPVYDILDHLAYANSPEVTQCHNARSVMRITHCYYREGRVDLFSFIWSVNGPWRLYTYALVSAISWLVTLSAWARSHSGVTDPSGVSLSKPDLF